MSTRYLRIGNRKRKGISPVIATVMLVAVAVVIAAALAGFSGSLFGSYSAGPQVKIQSLSLQDDGIGSITMSNNGSADDAVIKVEVKNVGFDDAAIAGGLDSSTGLNVISANSLPIPIDFELDMTGAVATPALTSGQQVTAIVSLASGATITQTITVVSA